MKRKLTDAAKRKNKIRSTIEWKEFRRFLIHKQKYDPLTQNRLTPHAECHHLSQCAEAYDLLSEDRQVMLNSRSHLIIHQIYDIVHREGNYDVLKRIKKIVQQMEELTLLDDKYFGN